MNHISVPENNVHGLLILKAWEFPFTLKPTTIQWNI